MGQLLGRWNPRLHSVKISDAIEDIMRKILDKEEGEYISLRKSD